MPRETNQADKSVRPPRARVQMNGAPLSHCIASGRPCAQNRCSSTRRTSLVRVLVTRLTARTFRLKASRTVSGSHFSPLSARHHPLKSIVHRSFGPFTSSRGRPSTDQIRTGGRRRFLAETDEDPGHRAPARSAVAEPSLEHLGDLLGAPTRVALTQIDDADHDLLAGRQRARGRSPALLDEAQVALVPVAPDPLVARLPGVAELPAKLGDVGAGG